MNDLKLINGIGPVTEKRLHKEGVHTFAQVAKLSAEAVAGIIPYVSPNQIRRQGWIRQARKLATRITESGSVKKEAAVETSRQHYENFTVEFLLNQKNIIRRIRIVHVQSGDVDSWNGWDTDEISNFLARHTKAHFHRTKILVQQKPVVKPQPAMETPKIAEHPKQESVGKDYLSPITIDPAVKTPLKDMSYKSQSPPASEYMTDRVSLLNWMICTANSDQPTRALPHDQNFNVRLTLDISRIAIPEQGKLDVTGTLFAKKLGGNVRHTIGEAQVIMSYSPIISMNIDNTALAEGLYRLEARIKLIQIGAASLQTIVDTSFQGGLIQIY
jgi:hypothetical protein